MASTATIPGTQAIIPGTLAITILGALDITVPGTHGMHPGIPIGIIPGGVADGITDGILSGMDGMDGITITGTTAIGMEAIILTQGLAAPLDIQVILALTKVVNV
jgi:hypothetical protein